MVRMSDMSTSEAQKRAVAKYNDEKTDLIRLRVPKGTKDKWQASADRAGAKSLTAFVCAIMEEKLKEEQ